MSNMSYCRFRNTLADLRDCYDHLFERDDDDELSEEESRARKRLIDLCREIAQEADLEEEGGP